LERHRYWRSRGKGRRKAEEARRMIGHQSDRWPELMQEFLSQAMLRATTAVGCCDPTTRPRKQGIRFFNLFSSCEVTDTDVVLLHTKRCMAPKNTKTT
jgi:hypothetical protein